MLVKESSFLTDSLPTNHLDTNSATVWRPQLSICVYVPSPELVDLVLSNLKSDRYVVVQMNSPEELLQYLTQEKDQLDCLILQEDSELSIWIEQLQHRGIFLPSVIVDPQAKVTQVVTPEEKPSTFDSGEPQTPAESCCYHTSEVYVHLNHLNQVNGYVDKAISQFITQAVTTRLIDESSDGDEPSELTNFIMRQQRRLAEKLHERLGYLGVYYKRNPQNFLRNLSPADRQELSDQLKSKYRQIVLSYFSGDKTLNNKIDEYVNIAFFADVPVTRLVEIHMELMDNFSKQLKIEGRSEEVLLDYRLTLIDTIAHLCEMYRRSIPRES